ncbi:aspartate/glutamate racemase family protein [Rhodobacteraceae bacterium S2214]|nr:aspartate/glutamate racemase family protein [Rhodobacteraceae bacterium S2214]
MRPAVTILQLDTHFPRIPGDVGCPQTYTAMAEIIRIPQATVAGVVTDKPDQINIAPFAEAIQHAKGDVIVTSCGFLSFWQDHLAGLTRKPFISSALVGLHDLAQRYAPAEILILTFDAGSLTPAHLGAFADHATGIVGLPKDSHLRQVIAGDQPNLDPDVARVEVVETVRRALTPHHKHILLECTNLPPYKAALVAAFGLPVMDILSLIENVRPNTVHPDFLG